jgi:hypothetical protein
VLDAAGDDGVAVARRDRVRGGDDRLHRGGTPAVDRRRRDRFAQVRQQGDDAGEVVALFAALLGTAPHQVVDLLARETGVGQDLVDQRHREVLAPKVRVHAVLFPLWRPYRPYHDWRP